MSGSLKQTAPHQESSILECHQGLTSLRFKARSLPEHRELHGLRNSLGRKLQNPRSFLHSKHERLCQTSPFRVRWRIVLVILITSQCHQQQSIETLHKVFKPLLLPLAMSRALLTPKDVALVIPTYNRSADVARTLRVLIKNKNVPGRVYIIDQSKDSKTKNVVKKYAKRYPLHYVFSEQPSSSRAENIGVRLAKRHGFKLLLISGDDMDYLPGYMRNLVKEFNDHPELMGLGGMDVQSGAARHVSRSRISTFLLNFFFLPSAEDHKFRVTGPYGLTSSPVIKRPIRNAQWIPGFNNCFRKEVYENYAFPESKGYNVLEDIDCSYAVYKKYGPGSLVITPACKVWHRESQVARYPAKKRIFVNHEDHFAFYYRHFHTPLGTLKMAWSLLGIVLGNVARTLASREKEAFLHTIYVIQAMMLAYRNHENIKYGRFRTFLNDDLSLKAEYQ